MDSLPTARENEKREKTFERVVEGRSDVAAAVRLFARIASYGSQRHEKRISKEKLLIKSLKVGAMWLEGKAVSQPLF